jgi:L-lactate dehydrogenase complex protein LldG
MSRADILGKVRTALKVPSDDKQRKSAVAERFKDLPRTTAPQRVAAPNTDLVACFIEELERQLATVKQVAGRSEIPAAVADYLRAHNQPLRLRHGSDARLAGLDFNALPDFEVETGPAAPDDSTGLSCAFSGIAETGTMALLSGPENPVTLGFLPDTHIIIVPRGRIVATYEDAFALLRAEMRTAAMPRTLNLISGPSRTADIGGRIVIGAHGPRRLLALITADL